MVIDTGSGDAGSGGQAQPQFVIEHEGKLYRTLSVVEYDPEMHGISEDQRAEIRTAMHQLKTTAQGSPVRSAMMMSGDTTSAQTDNITSAQTDPPIQN